MNNNNELTKIYKTFMEVYQEAKVSGNQAIWAKSIILLSMFNPSKNIQKYDAVESNDAASLEKAKSLGLKSVEFSPNAITITIGENELTGTPYKEFVFYGYQLNTDLHFAFIHELVSKYQKSFSEQGSDLVIDFQLLMRDCNLDTKHTGFYKAAFIEMLDRMFYSSAKIVMKNGAEINDRFIYKREMIGDFFHIKFGDIFTDSVIKDTWGKKIDWNDKMALKSGTPRILFDKVDMFNVHGESRFSVKTMMKLCECSSKSLNEAIQYYIDIGYVKECLNIKRGKTIVEKRLVINKSFSLKQFAASSLIKANKIPALPEGASASIIPALEAVVETIAQPETEKKDFSNLFAEYERTFNTESEVDRAVKAYEARKAAAASISDDDDLDIEYVDFVEVNDPWATVPDFEAWEREAAEWEKNKSVREFAPRKVWEGEDSGFDD